MSAEGRSTPVTVVGEVLVDLITEGRITGQGEAPGTLALRGRFGGSPANVAVGLSRLGVPVAFAGRLSRHGYGPWLRDRLTADGVDLDPSVVADEACTLAAVTLDAHGVATYAFYGPETADWHWRPAELPSPLALAGRAVHTGSLAATLGPGGEVIARWIAGVAAGDAVAISYDPNVRLGVLADRDRYRAAVNPYLRAAHLVKVSDEDLVSLYPGRPALDTAAEWLSLGPALVVVTRGGEGAVALHRDGAVVERPAPAVTVADTVGAGDAFTAGLLGALSSVGLLAPAALRAIGATELTAVIDRASLVAAITCSRPGADPPSMADVEAWPGGAPTRAG